MSTPRLDRDEAQCPRCGKREGENHDLPGRCVVTPYRAAELAFVDRIAELREERDRLRAGYDSARIAHAAAVKREDRLRAERDELRDYESDTEAQYRARLKETERKADRLRAALVKAADAIEDDRREPDKVLCHAAALRRAALNATTEETTDA